MLSLVISIRVSSEQCTNPAPRIIYNENVIIVRHLRHPEYYGVSSSNFYHECVIRESNCVSFVMSCWFQWIVKTQIDIVRP